MKNCEWCGSSKHESNNCNIRAKADLLRKGVNPHELFDVVLDVDSSLAISQNKLNSKTVNRIQDIREVLK